MARYWVLLDACVLVPVVLADTLLRLAERGLCRPLWSTRVVGEAVGAIAEIHPVIPAERIEKRFATMGDTFEDALVDGWEALEHTQGRPLRAVRGMAALRRWPVAWGFDVDRPGDAERYIEPGAPCGGAVAPCSAVAA